MEICVSRRLCVFLFFSLPLFIITSISNAQTQRLAAYVNGSYHDLPVVYLPSMEKFPYIGIQDLADLLDLRTYYSEKARKVILYLGDNEIKITAMNPFVAIGDRIVQLPVEARYADGDIFVPLPFFFDLIAPFYSDSLRLTRQNTSIMPPKTTADGRKDDVAPNGKKDAIESKSNPRPTSVAANIVGIDVEQKTNGTLIRIRTASNFNDSDVNARISRGWLYVDVFGGKLDQNNIRIDEPAGIIHKIVPVQLSQVAQLSFQYQGEIASRKIYTDNNAHEILVSLTTTESVSPDILKSLAKERQKWLIDTIVIDPGHGGRDPGAIGPNGVQEKEVTLGIAKKLKELLNAKSDVRVVMTRENDRFVPLRDRTHLANQEQGKLFISIHANSNPNNRINGLTTYFLGPAKTEEALEVSRRENAVINYEQDNSAYANLDTESYILLTLAQNAYQQESQELAALVQSEIAREAEIKDRGVKQAGYYVLIGASMPNILVEVAFISNKDEEKKLNSSKFQKKIAEGLMSSILKLKEKYESGI